MRFLIGENLEHEIFHRLQNYEHEVVHVATLYSVSVPA
jgi:hypothetical protein